MRSSSRWARSPIEPAEAALALCAVALLLGACGAGDEDGSDAARGAGTSTPAAGATSSGNGSEAREPRLLDGGERVIFIGDSIAATSPPTYADLLPEALGARASGVETVNLSEPGSTSGDWRPGKPLFSQGLEPELAGADLVVVTVGGNDLERALGGLDGVDSLSRADAAGGAGALRAAQRLSDNLAATFAAIRGRSPRTRIAYVTYPDYSRAAVWKEAGGAAGTLALRAGLTALTAAAAEADPDLVVNMTPITARAGVDSLLADSEHLSPTGHELYARRLARALTGQ